MEQLDLLGYVVAVFERLGIRYFVTGSFATIFYGEFRTTRDIDIVAAILPAQVSDLCASFPPPEFYVSDDAVRDAIATGFQFNILHMTSGLKIDVMIPGRDAYDRQRFDRARRGEISESLSAMYSSPEDIIVKKLAFYQEGGSDKHLSDIAGVLRISGEQLDYAYLAHWTTHFGLDDLWQTVLARVKESP